MVLPLHPDSLVAINNIMSNSSFVLPLQIPPTSLVPLPISQTSCTVNSGAYSILNFLPDFTEHPKPKPKQRPKTVIPEPVESIADDDATPLTTDGSSGDESEITFWQDFVAGGMAGSASVIVGHPLDTLKVRVQNSTSASLSIVSSITEFGGFSSLFRGMGAPLSAAAVINAIVFSSYGLGSKFWDAYLVDPNAAASNDDDDSTTPSHDPWQKSMTCGAFAGLVQCVVICPMEHVKCRIQVQHGFGSPDNLYSGPWQATKRIATQHGLTRLYQGWWSTVFREVPAFGLYFAVYDYMKDSVNRILARQAGVDDLDASTMTHTHTWVASACAGGIAGSVTWGVVYPVDVIKTKVQTSPLDTPLRDLSIYRVGASIVQQHGWRRLFRGLGITLIRAFPVNGTIFPVYEFTLLRLNQFMGS